MYSRNRFWGKVLDTASFGFCVIDRLWKGGRSWCTWIAWTHTWYALRFSFFCLSSGGSGENVLAFDLWGNGCSPSLSNFLKNQQTEGRKENERGRKRESWFYLQLFQLGESLDGFGEAFQIVVVQISETNTDKCWHYNTTKRMMSMSNKGS